MAAGVYTIWRREDQPPKLAPSASQPFVYVGYSGCTLTADKIAKQRAAGKRRKALWKRLQAHAAGRRSGDQFAVYVADRFVLPTLSAKNIANVAEGRLSLDDRIRSFVAAHLAFRWVETPDGETALEVERMIQRGEWEHGQPMLNPLA